MPKHARSPTPPASSSNPPTPPSPKTPKRAPKPWSADEEAQFAALVNQICLDNIWAETKKDHVLALRGANGIRSHWQANFKKAFKEAK